jgi:flavodoxin
MKAWVIYDSVFGNTEKIAQAISAALGYQDDVSLFRAGAQPAELPAGLDLMIVGSPTRQFRQTNAVRDFVKNIPEGSLKGIRVATFDTRFAVDEMKSAIGRFFVRTFGYAAKPIADGLKKKGGELAALPEGFIVVDTEGPLKAGEPQRAADWARQVVSR